MQVPADFQGSSDIRFSYLKTPLPHHSHDMLQAVAQIHTEKTNINSAGRQECKMERKLPLACGGGRSAEAGSCAV